MNRLPALALALALAGCATPPSGTTTISPAAITEAQTTVAGLTKLYADIQADFPNVAPKGTAADNQIQAALTSAATAVAALPALAAAADQGTKLSAIASDATEVLNVLATILPPGTLPSDIALGLQAAEVIIPDLVAVASTVGTPKTGALPLTPRFAASGMTVTQARGVLAGVK